MHRIECMFFTLEGANGIKLASNQGVRIWRMEQTHRCYSVSQFSSTGDKASWSCSVAAAGYLHEHFTGSKEISEHRGLLLLHYQNGFSSVYAGSQVILPPKGSGKEMYFWEQNQIVQYFATSVSSRQAFRLENRGTNLYLLTERQELQKWRIPFTDAFPSYWLKICKLLCPSESRQCLRVMSTVPKTKASTHDWEMLIPAEVSSCRVLAKKSGLWRVRGDVLTLLYLKWLSAPCENSFQLNLCW